MWVHAYVALGASSSCIKLACLWATCVYPKAPILCIRKLSCFALLALLAGRVTTWPSLQE